MRKLAKIIFLLASVMITTNALAADVQGAAAPEIEILFERRSTEEVAPGVYHHRVRQVTSLGFRDIYVLSVPTNNPNIVIGPVESVEEHGLRETLTTLLDGNNAVAGINADFFGLANIRTASFGPTVQDGELTSVSAWLNLEEDVHAALYIPHLRSPFIEFPQAQIEFLNNGQSNIEIQAINKVTDMVFPVIINRHAMDNTEQLDERFEGLFKIAVENGFITYLSEIGETVDVPENGFLVIMSQASAGWIRQFFAVGQTAQLNVTSNVNFAEMSKVIGGGGRILLDGEFVEEGLVIAGRQPRTAVGITQDGSRIIMAVVDGRRHSIGATHEETAEIMRQFGAFNAMMMDGGGSSTMGISTTETPAARVVNNPADYSQRRIINALGVFNRHAPQTPMRLEVQAISGSTNPNVIYASAPSRVQVFGVDGNLNRIDIPWEQATVTVVGDPYATWDGNYFTASRMGEVTLNASFNGMTASRTFEVRSLQELVPVPARFVVEIDAEFELNFRGIDDSGWRSGNLHSLEFRVSNPELGSFEGNIFTASAEGMGYIEARLAGLTHHVAFAVIPATDEDDEEEVAVPDFSGFVMPENIRRTGDFLRGDLSGEPPYGSFDIVAVGRTAVSDADNLPAGFADADAAARASFTRNLTRGLLVGESNWANDIAPIYRWNSNYHVHRQGNVLIIQMSAADGGFFRTNPEQWRNFSRDIAISGAEHVIVMMDANPITSIPAGELEFFSEIMSDFISTGMSVFVISAQGEATRATVRDGIRYINLGSMWTSENTRNDAFSMLRLRVSGGQIMYDLQGIR